MDGTVSRSARTGVRDWLGRPLVVAAGCLLVFGLLTVLIEVQSPSLLYWTGRPVQATSVGGIVYYTAGGEHDTLTAPGPAPPRPWRPKHVTVYVDRHDPSRALLLTPTRWLDAALVGLPFLAAALCLLADPLRRRARRRRYDREVTDSGGDSFGHGLDPEYVSGLLRKGRGNSS